MPQSFASLHYHIVFSTKNRQPWMTPDVQRRFAEYVGGILRNQSSRLIAVGGMPDHVHLLASLGRTLSVADGIRLVKTNSSAWIHDELAQADFQWQRGYGAFSVSFSQLDHVKAYLANQEEHHRQLSFQEEFVELLRRHQLEWDERYIWD